MNALRTTYISFYILEKKINVQDDEEEDETDENIEKLAELEQQVKEQDERHTKIIYDLEKKAVIDKDRYI